MVHAFTGLLFMILGPLQFVPPIRNKFINYHRWAGRIFLAASILVVFSSFVMVTKFPFAGLSEKTATFLFGTIFFVSIYQAYSNIKKRNIALHREWVIRVFSIGFGISMIRAFIGIFLAFTDYTQKEIFGLAFWGGFGSTLLVGEIWIRATRKRKALSSEKSIS